MARYHVNKQGNPGLCHAQQQCPFGGVENHYASPAEARQAFEQAQQTFAPSKHIKNTMANVQAGSYIYLENDEEGFVQEIYVTGSNVEVVLQASNGRGATATLPFSLKTSTKVKIARQEASPTQLAIAADQHPLSRNTAGHTKAYELALQATARNSRPTVLEAQEDDHSVTLIMSSWPRAREAEQAFIKQGWATEYLGSLGGCVIRVSDPASSPRCFVSTDTLAWQGDHNQFVAEASELKNFNPYDFSLVSQKDGRTTALKLASHEQDTRENEVLSWTFKPAPEEGDWTVKVFND